MIQLICTNSKFMRPTFIYFIIAILFLNVLQVTGRAISENPDADVPPLGVVSGVISEKGTNEPMEYSTVAIYSAIDSSLVGGTVSDREGNFEVDNLPDGDYYLEANYIGYEKIMVGQVFISPDSRKLDIGIIEMAVNVEMLNEVEIVADRKHVEYRLDKKVVNVSQDLNAAGGTAVDVLENTPSVTVDIEGNVSLRGSGSFTVLIDGKPSVLNGNDALRQIPASAIENIEIITNPSAKYDPDGNSGIINVVMKNSPESGTTGIINASAGRNNKFRGDFLLNRKQNNWNFFVGGNYNSNPRPGSLTREQITYSDTEDIYLMANGNYDFRFGGGQIKTGISHDFSEKTSISFEASAGSFEFSRDRSNNSHEYTLPATEDIYYVSTSTMNRSRLYYNLNANFTHSFDSKDHQITARAQFNQRTGKGIDLQNDYNTPEDFIKDEVIPESNRATETSDEYQVRLQADYTRPVGSAGKFESGYQIRFDDEFENNVYDNYDPAVEKWLEDPLYTSELYFLRSIQSAYATYGGESKNGFQYMLGLRGEHTYRNIDHEKTDNYVINRLDYYPTIHLGKQFRNDNQLMLSYGKRVERPRGYYLEPNIRYVDPYTVEFGNPELEPEYIHSFELGYQKGWERDFLALELYYRNTQNLITRITEYDEKQELFIINRENLNQDHSAGAEVMINWKFWNKLTLNGSFTPYYYAISGMIGDAAIEENSFNWRSTLNTTYQITPTTRIQANSSYRSKSASAQGYSTGYYYMNIAFRQDLFKRKLSATLQLNDLFGTVKMENFSFGSNFEQHVIIKRESRVFMLTLSYKINNYRLDEWERGGDRNSGGGDIDKGI